MKKIQKPGLESQRSFLIGKNGCSSHHSYITEKEIYFQEKIEKNPNNSKELWKAPKSLGMKSGKVNQSKMLVLEDF